MGKPIERSSIISDEDPTRFAVTVKRELDYGQEHGLHLASITHIGIPYAFAERMTTARYFQSTIIVWEKPDEEGTQSLPSTRHPA